MGSPISYDLQGQQGGVVVTTSASGDFRWIQLVQDTTFSDLVSSNISPASDLVGPVLPAGLGIGGRFSYIEITGGGPVIAYYA